MYFAIIIPILLVIYLLLFHRPRITWWEILIPFGVTFILIAICQAVAYQSAITDTEYLGHMAMKAVYEEPMSYDDECSEKYKCGEDDDGNPEYCTRYYHCVSDKWPNAYFITDKGSTLPISVDTYYKYEKLWERYKYRTEKITISSGGYTTTGDLYNRPNHGNKHEVSWNNLIDTSHPISERMSYNNYIQASKSLYNPRNLSEKELLQYKLFDYPKGDGYDPLLAMDSKMVYPKALKQLQYANGWLNTTMGGFKKVRLWVLMYRNQPEDTSEMQRVLWKNGNKNEFIVMLNVDDNNNLTWFDIMSWTEKEDTKIIVRNYIANLKGKKIDNTVMHDLSVFLTDTIRTSYVKPSFKKYSYLDIPPSWTAIIISHIIILIVCIGTGIFAVINDYK